MGRRRRKGKAKAKTKATESNRNSSSSVNDDQNPDRDLPEGPLIQILESLDAKTLCRFRCVSNRWNSIISDPIFMRHFLSRTCSYTWTLLHRDGFCNQIIPGIASFNRVYSYQSFANKNSNPSAIVSVLDFPSYVTEKHQSFPNSYNVLASSDGLLLCSVDFPTRYYVCNPIIEQWVALPSRTQVHNSPVSEGLVTRVDGGGTVTSYKVVMLMEELSDVRMVEIFASDTGEWTTHRLKTRFHRIVAPFRPFCFNGILHYNTFRGLLAYDPYTDVDNCRFISLESTSLNHYSDFLCGVSNGRLSCISSLGDRIDVWVLKDYATAKWRLKYKKQEHKSRVYPPFAFHPFDPTIIYTYMDTRIFSYDLVRKNLDLVFDVGFGDLSGSVVIPVVLPPFPTQVPKPSW